jgi:hypothetical protein
MGNTSSSYNQFYFSNIATYLFSIIVDIDIIQSIGSYVAKIKTSLVRNVIWSVTSVFPKTSDNVRSLYFHYAMAIEKQSSTYIFERSYCASMEQEAGSGE